MARQVAEEESELAMAKSAVQPEAEKKALESLAVIPRAELVRPLVSVEEAKKAWDEYVRLCQEILDESDYIYYVHYTYRDDRNEWKEAKPRAWTRRADAETFAEYQKTKGARSIEIKPRKKRSAWDKLAKFFGLTIPKLDGQLVQTEIVQVGSFIIERRSGEGFSMIIYQDAETLGVKKASATVSVSSHDGARVAIGEAVCSVAERERGAGSFAHPDHDIPTTAFTRALNRAISRCIGTGEVSAEEMEEPQENIENPKTESVPQARTQESQKTGTGSSEAAAAEIPHAHTPSAAAAKPPEEKADSIPASTAKFAPLGDKAGLGDRLKNLIAYVNGPVHPDNQRANSLVYYLPFCISIADHGKILSAPVRAKLERVEGRWDPELWKEEFKKLSDRKERVAWIEQAAASAPKDQFIAWARKVVEDCFGNAGGEGQGKLEGMK